MYMYICIHILYMYIYTYIYTYIECKPFLQFLLPHHQAQKHELRINSMVTSAATDFRIFHFLLTWYDKAWSFISKKYNFILCISIISCT